MVSRSSFIHNKTPNIHNKTPSDIATIHLSMKLINLMWQHVFGDSAIKYKKPSFIARLMGKEECLVRHWTGSHEQKFLELQPFSWLVYKSMMCGGSRDSLNKQSIEKTLAYLVLQNPQLKNVGLMIDFLYEYEVQNAKKKNPTGKGITFLNKKPKVVLQHEVPSDEIKIFPKPVHKVPHPTVKQNNIPKIPVPLRGEDFPMVVEEKKLTADESFLHKCSAYTQNYINSLKEKKSHTQLVDEFKLSTEETELLKRFIDPISQEVMNIPLHLNDQILDLKTIVDCHGIDPFSRYPFVPENVSPSRETVAAFQEMIKLIQVNRKLATNSSPEDFKVAPPGGPVVYVQSSPLHSSTITLFAMKNTDGAAAYSVDKPNAVTPHPAKTLTA